MKNRTEVYLPQKVRQLLITYLQNDKVTTEDVYAIFSILKHAETEAETEIFIRALSVAFPVLQEYQHYREDVSHASFEQWAQDLIPTLIKRDPLLATQVMRAIQQPGMTREKLHEQFPTITG